MTTQADIVTALGRTGLLMGPCKLLHEVQLAVVGRRQRQKMEETSKKMARWTNRKKHELGKQAEGSYAGVHRLYEESEMYQNVKPCSVQQQKITNTRKCLQPQQIRLGIL